MAPPSKKRKISKIKTAAVAEITFDPAAREEYLTGFHKRKLQRIKHAQEENAKKAHEEKLRFRRELRQQRKEDVAKHVEEVNALMRKANPDLELSAEQSDGEDDELDEWGGFDEAEVVEEIDREDEYIDEDKYTTVTVETVDVSKEGLNKTKEHGSEEAADEKENTTESASKKRIWTKEKPKADKPKKKKKKFRYEAPAERKLTRLKERSKGKAKAAARMKK